jgi:predicted ATPase/GAF domain-containing protein/tRNA A-37 threonylcarbamoyl transferase component Bud32
MLTLPNYQIGTQIYESANSLIYQGIRKTDDQPIILKVLKEDYPTPEELTRYRQEYDITRWLTGVDGVVKAYALEKYQNTLVIILEDFEAQSLKILNEQRTFTLEELLTFAIRATEILEQIHRQNIIHKDINPSNLVLNPNTGVLKIIDFGIATQLSKQHLRLTNPEVLEGTLAYMSPEQTGRMNRALDYRSDFYSLGVTFYELFSGKLPFESTDAMELVHCHIAKTPLPVCEVNLQVPPILSDIIMKLMAKNAEDRYQSAWGIKADLEECKLQLVKSGQFHHFSLAQHDISEQLQIPQKLYGRELEINTLLAGFERAAAGKAEIMLVAGYSGVGKSVLVKEIYKSLSEKRSYFISGKFDQFQRNIPYSALVNAFSELTQQLLTENEQKLSIWKEKLLSALEPNGQIIIDLIPEIEWIIGKQLAVPELGSSESQNRFNLVFQNLMRVFCRPEHPLVMFLDDLQWVDSATLQLFDLFLTHQENISLYLIGAYRDNEVEPMHPLMMTLDKLRENCITINQIILKPLCFEHINQLIAESLHQDLEVVSSLTDLVMRKTDGNPFFVNQFLQTLWDENLLRFVPPDNNKRGRWHWNLAEIEALNITDNVVDLMIGKLKKLPDSAQRVLRLAACIGNRFDLDTLSVIYERSVIDTFQDLKPVLTEGLILPIEEPKMLDENNQYSSFIVHHSQFLHDRVQEASYALISETDKPFVHWQIGHFLLKHTLSDALDSRVFDIVNHINLGLVFIREEGERQQVIQLNRLAVKKAKLSNAFQAALKYVRLATLLLNQDAWQSNYALTFELFKEQAEVEYLTGHHQVAEEIIDQLLEQAQSLVEQVEAFALLKTLQATQGTNYAKGLAVGLRILRTAGLNFPENEADQQLAIEEKLAQLRSHSYHHNPAKLIKLVTMHNKMAKVKMKLCMAFWETAFYNGASNLMLLCGLNLVDLSWQYGHTNESGFGYLLYGVFLTEQGNYQSGYDFGQLALQLIEKLNDVAMLPKVRNLFCNYINYHCQPFSSNALFYEQNIQKSCETGEIVFGVWAAIFLIWSHLLKGTPLEEVYQLSDKYCCFVQNTNDEKMLKVFEMLRLVILNLQGNTLDKYQLRTADFEIEDCLVYWQKNGFLPGGTWYAILMGQVLLIRNDYKQALVLMKRYAQILTPGIIMFPLTQYYFYYSLNLAACLESGEESAGFLQELIDNQEKLKRWAENCPDNFQAPYLLVNAEYQRIVGDELAAMEGYDQAIRSAQKYGLIQLTALANEIAAGFWLKKGKNKFAQLYLIEAHYAYQQWGAVAKVKDLEAKYPELVTLPKSLNSNVTLMGTISATTRFQTSTLLDLDSVTKVAQTLAGEIVLAKLLEKIMYTLIENAGAQRGLLILEKDEQWVIEAGGAFDIDKVTVLESIPIERHLPIAIVNYVVRTREPVVLADAGFEGIYTEDSYVCQHQVKSVLCSPILHQGQLIGLLYLENNLIQGAFTPARLKIVDILSSQAAISLQNALLYRTLEQKVERRTAQLAQANEEISRLAEQLKEENLRMSAELGVAKQLQQMVLPKEKELEQVEGLDIAGFMEPADEVGGDYYEILNHDGQVKIAIGDVTGHGLESGVIMLMVQTMVRALLLAGIGNPRHFLNVINRTVYHNVRRMEADKNLTLSLLDYKNGQIQITGQHEEVLVVREGGEIERVDTTDLGFMVGVIPDISRMISDKNVQLQRGDGIVLYTDGITEAHNPKMDLYGLERLCHVVQQNWQQTAYEIQQSVIADVRQFIGEQKVFDDITLLVLKQK